MLYRRYMLRVPVVLVLALVTTKARAEDRPASDPVDCYAVLVLASAETNAAVNKDLHPLDVNCAEIVLARVYGALIKAGFKDENITVLYASGGVKPDPSEKRHAEQLKRLTEKHFNRKGYQATKENVLGAFRSCAGKLDANDQFVFWICAHGAADGVLELAESTYLTPQKMDAAFEGFRSRTNYMLFDCCHSKAILDRTNVDNAVMVSTTGFWTEGWLDRDFSNCAKFLECKIDPNCDKDGNRVVDCREAFEATMAGAKKHEPVLEKYIREGYRRVGCWSVIPKIKVGNRFVRAPLGPSGKVK